MGRLTLFIITFFIYTLLVSSCVEESSENKIDNSIVTDDLGREIKLRKKERILSLTPSITEILYKIVDHEKLIARTPYDSIPAEVLQKTVVNNYPLDFEKIISLKPDIIFAKEGMVALNDADRLHEINIPVFIQRYDSISDIFRGIQTLGRLLNREHFAQQLVDSLKIELDKISIPCMGKSCPKVLLMIEEKPVFVYGLNNYSTGLIKAAGGCNAMDKVFDSAFPTITREYLLKINPDIIIGADSNQLLKLYPETSELNAIRNGKVYTADMEPISRPGPRFIEGIKLLKSLIHEN